MPEPTGPMLIVRILRGARDGERFVTPMHGLTEGMVFRYLDEDYTFVRDPNSGRWGAVPAFGGGPRN